MRLKKNFMHEWEKRVSKKKEMNERCEMYEWGGKAKMGVSKIVTAAWLDAEARVKMKK